MEFYDFEEFFDDANLEKKEFSLWDFSERLEVFQIVTADASRQSITNKDIAAKAYSRQLDHVSFKAHSSYVCCIFIHALGQAGALGIWDAKKMDWCFWFADELFCVEDIKYDETEDLFHGTCEFYYPMSPLGGRVNFEIGPDRTLIEKNYDYIDGDGQKHIGKGQGIGW